MSDTTARCICTAWRAAFSVCGPCGSSTLLRLRPTLCCSARTVVVVVVVVVVVRVSVCTCVSAYAWTQARHISCRRLLCCSRMRVMQATGAQHRAKRSPFRRTGSALDVVNAAAKCARALYDPLDADANLFISLVCRRLGLSTFVEAKLIKHGVLGLTAAMVRNCVEGGAVYTSSLSLLVWSILVTLTVGVEYPRHCRCRCRCRCGVSSLLSLSLSVWSILVTLAVGVECTCSLPVYVAWRAQDCDEFDLESMGIHDADARARLLNLCAAREAGFSGGASGVGVRGLFSAMLSRGADVLVPTISAAVAPPGERCSTCCTSTSPRVSAHATPASALRGCVVLCCVRRASVCADTAAIVQRQRIKSLVGADVLYGSIDDMPEDVVSVHASSAWNFAVVVDPRHEYLLAYPGKEAVGHWLCDQWGISPADGVRRGTATTLAAAAASAAATAAPVTATGTASASASASASAVPLSGPASASASGQASISGTGVETSAGAGSGSASVTAGTGASASTVSATGSVGDSSSHAPRIVVSNLQVRARDARGCCC